VNAKEPSWLPCRPGWSTSPCPWHGPVSDRRYLADMGHAAATPSFGRHRPAIVQESIDQQPRLDGTDTCVMIAESRSRRQKVKALSEKRTDTVRQRSSHLVAAEFLAGDVQDRPDAATRDPASRSTDGFPTPWLAGAAQHPRRADKARREKPAGQARRGRLAEPSAPCPPPRRVDLPDGASQLRHRPDASSAIQCRRSPCPDPGADQPGNRRPSSTDAP